MWLTSEQLKKIIELHENSLYQREIYVYGIGRITDFEQYDFIKTTIKTEPEKTIPDLYKRVGILNLFNPYHVEGMYELNLQIYEERIMFNIICDLAKREGIKNVKNLLNNKAPVENADQFIKNPPKEGNICYN